MQILVLVTPILDRDRALLTGCLDLGYTFENQVVLVTATTILNWARMILVQILISILFKVPDLVSDQNGYARDFIWGAACTKFVDLL
jgi:hypothetical protein